MNDYSYLRMRPKRLYQNLLIVFLLLAAVASSKNGKVLGYTNSELQGIPKETNNYPPPEESLFSKYGGRFSLDEDKAGVWKNEDDIHIIYSSPYTKKIYGYAGETPVYLVMKEGKILEISLGRNAETPSFVEYVTDSGLFSKWNGLTLNEVQETKVDGVSGATFSSEAIIKTVKTTAQQLEGNDVLDHSSIQSFFSIKAILAILVLISGLLICFFLKKRKWRTVQQVLNVIVLGVWCGHFISFSWLVGWISSGANFLTVLIPAIMLLLAVLLPMLKKKSYYCMWVCPFGSAQELISRVPTKKYKINQTILKYLNLLREGILYLLLFLAWLGISFDLIDYEPFSAFIFSQADKVVIIIAILFLTLSLFINRPWCRFMCPTGQILDWCQTHKNIKK